MAGQFAGRLFGSPPEPWERSVDDDLLRTLLPDEGALAATDYDHAGWFFGAGGQRPRWFGYTLGYRVVGDWLTATPGIDGDAWVNIPAEAVLADARAGVLRGADAPPRSLNPAPRSPTG